MNIPKNEMTTGVLVLLTMGVLTLGLVIVGMPGLIRPMNTYRIYYDNANGIRPGAPVLLAGREIGKVTELQSPVPPDKRPAGHPDYEVSIDVQVDRDAEIYHTVVVHLTQQGLMGQMVVDFVKGDATSGLAEDGREFVGMRMPDLSESVSKNIERLTGPESDLAKTIKSTSEFMEKLNGSEVTEVISNTEQMTDTLKREPWRLIWPSTKKYPGDKEPPEEQVKVNPRARRR
jgi:ABC-type transporter Mla subunit MlaD